MKVLFFLFILLFSSPAFALDDIRFFIPDSIKEENIPLKIINIDISQDKDKSQLFIEFTKSTDKVPSLMSTLETVTFDLDIPYKEPEELGEKIKKTDLNGQVRYEIIPEEENAFLNSISWTANGNITSFEIKRKHFSPGNFKKINYQNLLVLEFPRNYFVKESSTLKPGIIKHFIRAEVERGPIVANALEIDLENKNISIKVGMPSKQKIKAKQSLSTLVKVEKAFGGINANFFDVKAGNPLGALITDGLWVTGPIYDRVAIGFTEDKKVFIDKAMLTGNVTVIRGFRKKVISMFEIDGLNTPFGLYKKVGYFTTDFDTELHIPKHRDAFIVNEGCIKKIDGGTIEVPQDGYVLLPSDVYHFDKLKRKDCLRVDWINNPSGWANVTEAVSGGPYLIKDGEIFVDESAQKFRFGSKDAYAPRSAIGIGKNKKLYLIAVDGRHNGYSVGVTFQELAQILKKLDLKDAINLDGGGSTTLVADGQIINTLSEHHERKISNALLIFYK